MFILIAISILVAAGFLIAFLWSAKSGQYDDDYTPSVRILFEDTPKTSKVNNQQSTINQDQNFQEKKKSKVKCK